MRKRKFLTNIRNSLILDLGHSSSKENSPSNQECWLYENLGPLKGSCDNTVDQPRGINVVQFPTISHKRTRIEEIKHALFSQLQRPKRKPLQEFFIDAEEELESKWHSLSVMRQFRHLRFRFHRLTVVRFQFRFQFQHKIVSSIPIPCGSDSEI